MSSSLFYIESKDCFKDPIDAHGLPLARNERMDISTLPQDSDKLVE